MRCLLTATSFQCYRTSARKHGAREMGVSFTSNRKERSPVAAHPFLVKVDSFLDKNVIEVCKDSFYKAIR